MFRISLYSELNESPASSTKIFSSIIFKNLKILNTKDQVEVFLHLTTQNCYSGNSQVLPSKLQSIIHLS